MLKIGIPKGESLSPKILALLKEAGLAPRGKNSQQLRIEFESVDSLALSGYLLRTRRVPYFVKVGHVDLGIVGEDVLEERGCDPQRLVVLRRLEYPRLGLHATRVVVFCAKDDPTPDIAAIPHGSLIVSEYPRLTTFSLRGRGMMIDYTPGGSEAEVPLAYRFGVAVCDTGQTLADNGLKEIGTLRTSVPLLVGNRELLEDTRKQSAVQKLLAALDRVSS